ncbi:hypothetical protein QYM36_008373 [Artemia franciscana]|uniref:Reverse transcriptase domain-containing protein n=1 Tax=Artemia franciscana TaxID=6661 RepID=A0AA88LDW0_ARTSF|nr:hypothetical protein QYM36_008373 [Artemia franciscana]
MTKRVIQLNIRGMGKSKVVELENLLVRSKPDIVLIQETLLNEQKTSPNFKGYSMARWDKKTGPGGGLMTLVKDNIPTATDFDFKQFKDAFQKSKERKIIAGDFNLHNPMWDSTLSPNHNSNLLADLITDPQNMVCLITPIDLGTRLNPLNGKTSTIYLTIASLDLSVDFEVVIPSPFDSDHFPIMSMLNFSAYRLQLMKSVSWNFRKESWPEWQREVDSDLTDVELPTSVEELNEKLTQVMVNASERVFGYVKLKRKSINSTPGWNAACQKAYKERNTARHKFRRNPTVTNKIEMNAKKAIFRKIVPQEIKNGWKTLIETKFTKTTSIKHTIDCLVRLENQIKQGFRLGKETLAVFLDMTSAFDRENIPTLMAKLKKLNISPQIVEWIGNFLTERKIEITLENHSSGFFSTPNNVGLPQGGALSPLLFLVYCHDINLDTILGCKLYLYADDIAVGASSRDRGCLKASVQKALYYLENWTMENHMSFSTEKSVSVLFSRKNRTNVQPPILSLAGVDIQHAEKFCYLGILLDSKLLWTNHIDYLVCNLRSRANFLNAICLSKRGVPYSCVSKLIGATITSKLDYGSMFYREATKHNLQKLDPAFNQVLRRALGCLKTTPIPALYCELGVTSLQRRRNSSPLLSKKNGINKSYCV